MLASAGFDKLNVNVHTKEEASTRKAVRTSVAEERVSRGSRLRRRLRRLAGEGRMSHE